MAMAINGTFGLGETYLKGWWDTERLDEMINKLVRGCAAYEQHSMVHLFQQAMTALHNRQKGGRTYEVARRHYDMYHDVYEAMLDSNKMYSCGYWANARNLDQAQEAKMDMIAKKVKLQPGMRVLDIGCGWGGFIRHIVRKYDVSAVGITISKEQADASAQLCKDLPVDIRLLDYKDLKNESFDAIISIGMVEHVGHRNYRRYMETVTRCLKQNGLFLLHTIGKNESGAHTDPWISKYIFPNSDMPLLKGLVSSMETLMTIEDIHNFGPDYDKTLMAWFDNFDAAWPELSKKYPDHFYRMWKYYLLSSAGSFRGRNLQLWQIVMSRPDTTDIYRRPAV